MSEMIQDFADRNRLKTRIDEDGTKTIPGKIGHIYEYDDDQLAVMVIPDPPRRQFWAFTRTKFIGLGMTIRQDGYGEGAALFDQGSKEQVSAAIRAAGVRRKRIVSDEQRDRLVKQLASRCRRAPVGTGTNGEGKDEE